MGRGGGGMLSRGGPAGSRNPLFMNSKYIVVVERTGAVRAVQWGVSGSWISLNSSRDRISPAHPPRIGLQS